MKQIYLDHAATTYTDERVVQKMLPYFSEVFGNASSLHFFGQKAQGALIEARKQVAGFLGAKEKEIYFTSGGTESDNWAMIGGAIANAGKGKHIVTTAIEHHAIKDSAEKLKKRGFDVTYVMPDEYGVISPESIEKALRGDTILVSVMTANNEIGTVEPIEEIGRLLKERKILFHTDAVQAAGHLPIDVSAMNVDMLSLSAHKFYGPKGVGALYIRNGVAVDKYMNGGAQERNRRAGTENLAGIVGLAEALRIAVEELPEESERLTALRDHLIERVLTEIPSATLNGHRTKRLSNNANFCFGSVEGESMLLNLDLSGIAASSGSACMSGSFEPSYVLTSIGVDAERASSSLRLTLGRKTTLEDIDYTVDTIKRVIDRLKAISPF